MAKTDIENLRLLNKIGMINDEEFSSLEEKPLINIEKLHVNFKRGGKLFQAVKGANLKINDGEILGLVGESGSGKTTLGRATISLWDHALGKVEIEGRKIPQKRIKSVSKKNAWVYKKGQMIFQDPTSSLNRQSKVLDIVNEGLTNFKTIENEYKENLEIETKKLEDLNKLINALESQESYEAYLKDLKTEEYIKGIISKGTGVKLKKFIKDYNEAVRLDEEIEFIKNKIPRLKSIAQKKIKIIKEKMHSEKIILSEEGALDIKTFKETMHNEILEYKKFQERYEKDEDKTIARLIKRINRFYKQVTKISNELPETLKALVPKVADDIKGMKKAIKELEKAIKAKDKLNPTEKFYANSLCISLKLIIKKRDKVVTPLNSQAFDQNYLFIERLFMKRIHFYEQLIKDLDVRLKLEEEKRANVDQDAEVLINFYDGSIAYLNEYRGLLVSFVKETAHVSNLFKVELLDHEENGIEHFYKFAIKQGKINDLLKISITTWKAEKAIEYAKRAISKDEYELKVRLKEATKELDTIKAEYKNILEPKDDLFSLIGEDVEKFKESIKVTAAEFKKEAKELKVLEIKKENLIKTIDSINKVLKDKTELKEIKIERIKETLLKVGLNEDALNKYPSQFSGGQKQRIGIARTIITKPKFIIADEPISALDVSVQAQVINLMKEINTEMGLTMLFIAHDLQMVNYISDKIAVIYRGTIVEYGDSDKVYNSPTHPYTKSLIGAMPSLEEVGKELEVSDYSWDQHEYNEFSLTKLHEIEADHFVFGTDAEIKKWTK